MKTITMIGHMKKITPTDVPEDLIEQLAQRLGTDTATAVDIIAWNASVVREAVTDFDAERFYARTSLDIALGYLDRCREICRLVADAQRTTEERQCWENIIAAILLFNVECTC
jgi:hypothetical protein